MSTMKRCISLLLVLGILLGILAPAAQAAPVEEHATVDTSDVNIEGTNGFGNLLAQEIAENQQETEAENEGYPGGYTITDLEIVDNMATVTYDSMEEAQLVVALHTEDGMQLVTSAKVTVTPDATVATVTFEGEMPEYFIASAYLLDQYDYSPLCDSYDTPMYTREMQELLASTVDDYDPDKILNLDDDETTNFAVYADSTIVIVPTEGFNTVACIDDESMIYVINNADQQMTDLAEGDVVVYPYGEDEILIVKVASITVEGTTVTITGADLTVEEVFSHVKVESDSSTEEMTVIEGTGDEGVTYVGLTEGSDAVTPNAMEGGVTAKLYHEFRFSKLFPEDLPGNGVNKDDDKENTKEIKADGTLKLGVQFEFDYYVSWTRRYVKFSVATGVEVNIGITGQLKQKVLKLQEFGVSPIVGVYIGIEPKVEFQASGELAWVGSFSCTLGFAYSNDKGGENLTTAPKLKSDIKLEGTLFFGVDLHPTIEVVGGTVVDVDLKGLIGFELSGKLAGSQVEHEDKNISHRCEECIQGDVHFKVAVSAEIQFLKCDDFTVDLDIFEAKYKLLDYYFSLTHGTLGLKTCPYTSYKIVFEVRDSIDLLMPNMEILKDDGVSLGKTNDLGVLIAWLPLGKTTVKATVFDEELVKTVEVTEDDASSKVVLKFGVSVSAKDYLANAEDTKDHGVISSGKCGEKVFWTLYASGLLEISGSGAMKHYDQDYRDTPWYFKRSEITSVVIRDGVTTIGTNAFYDCNLLNSVEIGDSVTAIGASAFSHCNRLSNIVIPESVTIIGNNAFRDCNSLSSVVLSDGVTTIGNYSFYDCDSLYSVIIPKNVTTIGVAAFARCDSLIGIYVDPSNHNYSNDDHGVLFDKQKTNLIQAAGTISGSYSIPDSVTVIGASAFYDCKNLAGIDIPDSVTTISSSAFSDCDCLTSIVIPDNVATISSSAFRHCDNLTNLKIGNSVTLIDNGAFEWCINLTTLEIPNSVNSIGQDAFALCRKLRSVTIGSGVTKISSHAFGGCYNLRSIIFVGDAPGFGSNVFYKVIATAYYPADNPTWTTAVMQGYGGTITWVPYTPGEGNSIISQLTEIPVQKPTVEIEAVYGGEYDTEITEEATIKTASFDDLVPGEQYVMLAMVSIEGEDPLTAENLLGIAQGAANEEGTLSFRYIQRTPYDVSYVVVCGASNKNLRDAVITFPELIADGQLHAVEPTVVYDGKNLTEGTDYIITGTVDYTETGEYTCYIRGIRNYTGMVECTYTVVAHEHSFTNYISDGNAICTEDGTKTAKCDHCDLTDTIADVGSALGHNMGAWNTVRSATCTENGEEQRNCTRCDHSESRTIEAVGHRWDNGVVTREPTEGTEGERLYTCTACGATRTESIPVIGHEHSHETIVTAPTCTEQGYTTYTCRCGESYTADYVDALGHAWGDWSVIQKPTTTEEGIEEHICTRCGHMERRAVAKLENPFTDVPAGQWFTEPILWALENGITAGTTASTFGPNDQCMRAHVVTFLWRAVGCPEPTRTDNPFVDVKPSHFYYKPVLWALENGITAGMDATHFGPTAFCNRAQVVTFLYRAMGSPKVTNTGNPFTDVPAGSFYEKPVLWAVANGVTAGLSATSFGPNSICNRAQIVTFLYRAFVD